jgi:hypothetical protein
MLGSSYRVTAPTGLPKVMESAVGHQGQGSTLMGNPAPSVCSTVLLQGYTPTLPKPQREPTGAPVQTVVQSKALTTPPRWVASHELKAAVREILNAQQAQQLSRDSGPAFEVV